VVRKGSTIPTFMIQRERSTLRALLRYTLVLCNGPMQVVGGPTESVSESSVAHLDYRRYSLCKPCKASLEKKSDNKGLVSHTSTNKQV